MPGDQDPPDTIATTKHAYQAIAVCEAERLVAQVVLHAPEVSASQGVHTCVDQRDAPRLRMSRMHFHAVAAHVERNVRRMKEVVGEVLLDRVPLVTEADHE